MFSIVLPSVFAGVFAGVLASVLSVLECSCGCFASVLGVLRVYLPAMGFEPATFVARVKSLLWRVIPAFFCSTCFRATRGARRVKFHTCEISHLAGGRPGPAVHGV